MELNSIIAIVALTLTYTTTLIATYINIRIKIKELEVKITSIQSELIEHKADNKSDLDKMISSHREDIKQINEKLDTLLDKLFELTKNNKK